MLWTKCSYLGHQKRWTVQFHMDSMCQTQASDFQLWWMTYIKHLRPGDMRPGCRCWKTSMLETLETQNEGWILAPEISSGGWPPCPRLSWPVLTLSFFWDTTCTLCPTSDPHTCELALQVGIAFLILVFAYCQMLRSATFHLCYFVRPFACESNLHPEVELPNP